MAYKVGTTIVIDDSGNVDWSRIANKPAIGTGDISDVSVVNGTPASGATGAQAVYGIGTVNTNWGGTATYNCYVESLSGGGAAGSVTITANRKSFNCNCACRC